MDRVSLTIYGCWQTKFTCPGMPFSVATRRVLSGYSADTDLPFGQILATNDACYLGPASKKWRGQSCADPIEPATSLFAPETHELPAL